MTATGVLGGESSCIWGSGREGLMLQLAGGAGWSPRQEVVLKMRNELVERKTTAAEMEMLAGVLERGFSSVEQGCAVGSD